MTRGINRFKGLAMILAEIDRTYKAVPDVDAFVRWTGEAPELSNQAVKAQWELTGKEIFRQALEWSEEVNRKIGAMPEDAKCAFDGVREALKAAHETADVAVVSSANKKAVEEEWQRQGLMGICGRGPVPGLRVKVCLYQRSSEKGVLPGPCAHGGGWRRGDV